MSTLDLLLSTAVVNGLRQFTVTRIGAGKIEWQAATRWHGRDGYAVAIADTPEQAATEALSAHPLPSGVSAPSIPNFTYPPERTAPAAAAPPKAASLDDWDDTPEPEHGHGDSHDAAYADGDDCPHTMSHTRDDGVTYCADCGEILPDSNPEPAADDLDGW